EAVQQRRQMEFAHGHPVSPLIYLEPFMERANEARSQTAAQLSSLAGRAPGAQHGAHHGFLRDVWDGSVGGLISGAEHAAAGAWDLTFRAIYDPHGAGRSWENLVRGVEAAVQHPGQFAEATVNTLTDSDLRHRDLPAWLAATAINVASFFVGAGEAKAVLK